MRMKMVMTMVMKMVMMTMMTRRRRRTRVDGKRLFGGGWDGRFGRYLCWDEEEEK